MNVDSLIGVGLFLASGPYGKEVTLELRVLRENSFLFEMNSFSIIFMLNCSTPSSMSCMMSGAMPVIMLKYRNSFRLVFLRTPYVIASWSFSGPLKLSQ